LLDEAGVLIATTTTAAHGSFLFDNVGLGHFQVREVVSPGVNLTRRPVMMWISHAAWL